MRSSIFIPALSTFPGRLQPSIIDALDFTSVFEMGTGVTPKLYAPEIFKICVSNFFLGCFEIFVNVCFRLTTRLQLLLLVWLKLSIYQYWLAEYITVLTHPAYQPCSLQGILMSQSCDHDGVSYLETSFPLRCFQRLSLTNLATQRCSWGTTGTPEVCPFRSSRTRNSLSQIPYAHDR